MVREVFFNADDFGMDPDTNRAILHAHERGVLTGASLMMGQAGTSEAIAMARATPSLQVGVHFHFNDSVPCTRPSWPWGASPSLAGWAIGLSPAGRRLVCREVCEQWRQFRASGLPCAFANSHHHLHCHPCIGRALRRTLRGTFSGWMRYGEFRCFGGNGAPRRLATFALNRIIRHQRSHCPFPSSDTLWGVDRLFAMDAQEIRDTAGRLGSGRHELLFHPRRLRNDRDTECLIQLKDALRS